MLHHQMLIFFTFSLYTLMVLFQSKPGVKASGFSVELIHPDSPGSPFYNASLSSSQILIKNAIHSMERLKHLQSLMDQKSVAQSVVIPIEGCHLMKFFIGTPPVEYLAVLDTGSDLTWIQCVPCTKCFAQTSALFVPNASSTYKMFSYGSQTCQEMHGKQYLKTNDCGYQVTYGDDSTTVGVLSSDTLSFDPTFRQESTFPKFIFGCGRNNQVTEQNPEVAGIFGLGGGSSSLVYQIRNQIHHRFSYCLVPHTSNATGRLFFGRKSIVHHPGVVSTPLVSKLPDTFYFVTLEGVSIGDKTVRSSVGKGNVFIDSGVTFPLLEPDLYDGLVAMVKDSIGKEPMQDPSGSFMLCYEADANIDVPDMVFHFAGANVRLKPVNTFEVQGDLVCMVILPSGIPLSIFGNSAQVNFLLEYDLEKKMVSFLPTDCTRQY